MKKLICANLFHQHLLWGCYYIIMNTAQGEVQPVPTPHFKLFIE